MAENRRGDAHGGAVTESSRAAKPAKRGRGRPRKYLRHDAHQGYEDSSGSRSRLGMKMKMKTNRVKQERKAGELG